MTIATIMTIASASPLSKRAGFEPFPINRGRTIYATLRTEDDTTKDAFTTGSLVLVPPQILIPGIDYNPKLKKVSIGYIGYTAGEGPLREELIPRCTWDPITGELKPIGKERNYEKTICTWQGPYPTYLFVGDPFYTSYNDARYGLYANYRLSGVLSEVMIAWGIEPEQLGSEIATPRVDRNLHDALRRSPTVSNAADPGMLIIGLAGPQGERQT